MRLYAFILTLFFVLAGCASEYHDNMEARKSIAETQAVNQRMAVGEIMRITGELIAPFEIEKYREIKGVAIPLDTKNESLFVVTRLFEKTLDNQVLIEITRSRAQVIQYLVPIIKSIYEQNLADFGTPMSSNEVLSKLVGQIPFVSTVGGMYGLGELGIRKAGDRVNAMLSDNASVNYKSPVVTEGDVSSQISSDKSVVDESDEQ